MERLNIDDSFDAGRGASWRFRAMRRLAARPVEDSGANDALRILRRIGNDFMRHYSPMLAPYTRGMAEGMLEHDLHGRERDAESGAVSLPLLAFQAAAAIGLASALWSVYLRLVAQIGGFAQ